MIATRCVVQRPAICFPCKGKRRDSCCSSREEDGPGSPRPFYLRYGFTDTGRVMWGENVLALDLTR
jgi:hypothetical protein